MPLIADIPVNKTPVMLTSSDVTALRVQNNGPFPVQLMGSTSAAAPTSWEGSIILRPFDIILPSTTLAELFPNMAALRVFAVSEGLVALSVAHG